MSPDDALQVVVNISISTILFSLQKGIEIWNGLLCNFEQQEVLLNS
jgi:hypothetical protein